MVEQVVASRVSGGGDEPEYRRLVRDWLASDECDLGCIEAERVDYVTAAARHAERTD